MSVMKIFTTKTYERAIRKVTTQDIRKGMEAAIAVDPTAGPVIPGTGGIRTIYFYHAGPDAIYPLTAYAKATREDLSPADKKPGPDWLPPSRKRRRNYDHETHPLG